MITTENAHLKETVLHKVGNKHNDGILRLSKSPLELDNAMKELLLSYFSKPFHSNEYFNLFHESGVESNLIYASASAIFDNSENLYEQSVNIAQHLYDQSNHPKIKDGELYVTYIQDIAINGELVDAVGIFKSESKDTFIKITPTDDGYSIETDEGISINKLDKACIVFNTSKEKGYIVAAIDNASKFGEARFWRDDFLHLQQHQNEFYHTQQVMKVYKDFVTEKLPDSFDVNKVDQAEFLNKSMNFFKEKEEFTMEEFKQEVIAQPQIIESFNNYVQEYQEENDTLVADTFKIEENAVKKQARVYKSIIKLDKNFHIYVHGNRERITKGYDESTGMHFYQLYFKEEA